MSLRPFLEVFTASKIGLQVYPCNRAIGTSSLEEGCLINVLSFTSALSCIEKWLKGQGAGKCPQCNAKAKRGDIRVIYSKTVSVVDTTDRDRALKVGGGTIKRWVTYLIVWYNHCVFAFERKLCIS